MNALYPEIEPHDHGMLEIGDGNSIYWESCGNPEGLPAVVLHGGPGSGASTTYRRFFAPDRYRIILFDQRNCGRSLPHAGEGDTDLSANTTMHLVGDIERLRRFLGVERWLVFGASWGSTLALAYAEQFPMQVAALLLAGVTTTRQSEIDWLCSGMAPLFPEQWAQFRDAIPEDERHDGLVAAYRRLLNDPDPAVRQKAAQNWHDWEAAPILLREGASLPRPWSDPRYLLARARIIVHYFHHHAWLENGILLREAYRLAGVPGVMVQGRLDLEAPLVTAWELSRVWSDGELVIVPNATHSPTGAGMSEAIVAASDRLHEKISKRFSMETPAERPSR